MADGAAAPEYLVVGHLTKPHGTKGEILVWSLTDRPDEVFAPGRTLTVGDEDGEPGADPRRVVVEESRAYRKGMLVKLAGVEDRTEAEQLVSRYLLVPSEELGEPEEDALWYHELLGMRVVTVDGREVGQVREVFETEPAHLLEVKGEGKVHLVPFVERVVKEIDREARRLVIEPPEGLLEL